jgi:hypothetical protein
MNCLRPLEHWDRGLEPHSRHGCMSGLSCVYVGSGLATGWTSVQGVLPTVYGIKKLKWNKAFHDVLCPKVEATGKWDHHHHHYCLSGLCVRSCGHGFKPSDNAIDEPLLTTWDTVLLSRSLIHPITSYKSSILMYILTYRYLKINHIIDTR